MSNKIDNSFGAGSANFDQSKTPKNTSSNASRKFGEFLSVDDRDDDIDPQAEAADEQPEESQSSGFGSIFGSFNSSSNQNQNYDREDSSSSQSSTTKPTESYRPGYEHKVEQKPTYKPKSEVEKADEKPHKQPEKVKELKQSEPMAAFQVPMQVDRMSMMPTAKVEKAAPVMPTHMVDQIVQEVRLGVNANGLAEFQFDLKSDVLDGLKLKISTKDGQVSATFIAENVHVKDAIEQGAQDLIKALQERGLQVANLQVNVGADTSGQGQSQSGGQQQQQQQQQHYSANNDYYADDRGSSSEVGAPGKDRTNTDYTL